MGESKRGGTKDERVIQALEQKQKRLNEIKKQLGVSEEAEFCGYLIHLQDKNEWVSPISTDTFIKLVKIEGNVRDGAHGTTQEIQSGIQIRGSEAGYADWRIGQFSGQ